MQNCWNCNETITPDIYGAIHIVGDYYVCGRDECIEVAGLELGLDGEYNNLEDTDNYSFADYIKDEYLTIEFV